jgi:2-polyprenyl-3-methyl-5-hydroxy-6-metoxy-1,4-benzoquinol methylase
MFSNTREYIAKKTDFLYFYLLRRNLRNMDSVLDVGCGWDSPIGRISHTFKSTGIDVYKPALNKSKKRNLHDNYVQGNVLDIGKFFKPKSFDAVIALDLIEHLNKRDALKLIASMERLARKKVLFMTPNGFTDQNDYDTNPYQVHKSGWKADEFKQLGFKVWGLRGLKYIRGNCASIKYKPWIMWGILALISEYLLHFFPTYSYHLFAVKNLSK